MLPHCRYCTFQVTFWEDQGFCWNFKPYRQWPCAVLRDLQLLHQPLPPRQRRQESGIIICAAGSPKKQHTTAARQCSNFRRPVEQNVRLWWPSEGGQVMRLMSDVTNVDQCYQWDRIASSQLSGWRLGRFCWSSGAWPRPERLCNDVCVYIVIYYIYKIASKRHAPIQSMTPLHFQASRHHFSTSIRTNVHQFKNFKHILPQNIKHFIKIFWQVSSISFSTSPPLTNPPKR